MVEVTKVREKPNLAIENEWNKKEAMQLLNIVEKRPMKDCRSQSIEEVKNCRAEKSKIYCEFLQLFMTTMIYYVFL